jgi:hypothetical protein
MSRRVTPVAERLARLSMPEPNSGCFLFLGAVGHGGYGRLQEGRRSARLGLAHRIAYESAYGAIPPGLTIDHLCRNPSCVNVAHLEAVTSRENTMRGQGRCAKNAAATHCPQGHPYAGDNLYLNPQGGRVCRSCRSNYKRLARQRRNEGGSL